MAEELYDTDFPNLRRLGFERTSEPAYYNCIAYVVGDLRRKWWPGEYHPHMSPDYWPPGISQDETLEAFVQALMSVGYETCEDGTRRCSRKTARGRASWPVTKTFDTHLKASKGHSMAR